MSAAGVMSDDREQARALMWGTRDAEDPEAAAPGHDAFRRTRSQKFCFAGAVGLLGVAALIAATISYRAGMSLASGPRHARLGSPMDGVASSILDEAEGKVAHHHKAANKSEHEHVTPHAPHRMLSGHAGSHGKMQRNKTSHKPVTTTKRKSTTTSPSTTAVVVDDHVDNPIEAVAHWEGWGVVFPWMQTSTSTTTTTTTTTYTGTTTFTTTTTSSTTSTTFTNTTTTTTNTSTTSTTTTPCVPATDGDKCYVEVMKTLRGVRITPDAFPGLSSWSTFEEVQTYLHQNGFPDCTLPCECKTASAGDDCYTSVMWVYWHGLEEHPEWYPNLTKSSPFEAVQAHVQMDKEEECQVPCRPQYTDEYTDMFCFSIIRPNGYERQIAEYQFKNGIGIFGCQGNAVLSSKTFTIGNETDGGGSLQTIPFHPAKVGVSKDGTAANTLLFLHAWTVVKDKTKALEHDWIIKVDPDAVLLPDRIQKHLAPHTGSKSYVRNCNSEPESEDFPMMFGSMEVLSKDAVKAFFNGGEKDCRKNLSWSTWGEDYFLGKCMLYLGVTPIDDFNIISDGVCAGVDCEDPIPGAFHPFKDVESWTKCWRQATRNGEMHLVPLPAV